MNNLYLLPQEVQNDNCFMVTDPLRVQHVNEILRLSKGDQIKVCLIDNSIGLATIQEIDQRSVTLHVFQKKGGFHPWCQLIVGLSRPPTCKKILEHATTLGVSHFHFVTATLSEKSYQDAKLFKEKKYLASLYAGLAQSSIYYQQPQVTLSANLSSCLNKLKTNSASKFLLAPDTKNTFAHVSIKPLSPLILAIGPERGWTTREIEKLEEERFTPIKISNSILRVETATFAALSQLELKTLSNPQ